MSSISSACQPSSGMDLSAGRADIPQSAMSSVFDAMGRVLAQWQDRTSRRVHLARVPDYLLKDMGMTRAEAKLEAAKPFWRA